MCIVLSEPYTTIPVPHKWHSSCDVLGNFNLLWSLQLRCHHSIALENSDFGIVPIAIPIETSRNLKLSVPFDGYKASARVCCSSQCHWHTQPILGRRTNSCPTDTTNIVDEDLSICTAPETKPQSVPDKQARPSVGCIFHAYDMMTFEAAVQ